MGDHNEVEFRVLGDLEARIGGETANLGHSRQRSVLAALLVEPNLPVPVDRLVDRVWADHPPRQARDTLYGYLYRLRRALSSADVEIARRSSGYVLSVDKSAVDLFRFRELVATARSAPDEEALRLLEEALGLWRGEPFSGLDLPWVDEQRLALERERLGVELDRNDLGLRLGDHHALLPAITALARAHPLDERAAAQCVLALYRCGRQAEALAHYQHVRHRLADDLGADPGAELRDAHRRVLAGDPVPCRPERAATVPRQLPGPPAPFVGRAAATTRLDELLSAPREPGGTVLVAAIGGIGGIGKTWLALHWAHHNLDRFPDGQLYADLRGFDPTSDPVSPSSALRGFLDALGVAPDAVPADVDARSGLYRSLVAGRRMLVVLDNARDTAQVLPLLPGSAECAVLVTSRHQLTGLTAAHGAHLLHLDVLTADEARELLVRRLGEDRLAEEGAAAGELLDHCGGLPLALTIATVQVASTPDYPLSELVEELRDSPTRLDALDGGELHASLRGVFAASYGALSAAAAEAFRLLGPAPGPDISLPAAANLLRVTSARSVLRELRRAHLVQEHRPGRYRMHDLIRLYAAERAGTDQVEKSRRLVDFYTHTAHLGDQLLNPYRPPMTPGDLPAGCAPHELTDRAEAMAWFDAEHANLLATQRLAALHGWDTAVWHIAWALTPFHFLRGHVPDHIASWRAGLAAAERLGGTTVRATAHRRLGDACARGGEIVEGVTHLQLALELADGAADAAERAHAHRALGIAWEQRGDLERALAHSQQALVIYQDLDNPVWHATALNSVGWCLALLGDYDTARGHCERALSLAEAAGYHDGVAGTLDSLGYIAHNAGRHGEAITHYNRALGLFRANANAYEAANTLVNLGDVHAATGAAEQARSAWQAALNLYRGQHRLREATGVAGKLAG
ncbi:BTAD domain-containing putative transcriptional regulator [Actinokineospora auranticolor]|uniref:DNA-binding SARP family transcriptional activator n=1 Tax=Actinokineospora auranticolor TaxID=155976 RepID=A0A2S6GJM5_9PSEU|nr:BTAD domain-containing putative transcriptional regulator [Actinokineospora auranticolor]PPK65419.1 DNA-binding SARP family transcriptional activator [Actinokineospora auranticolor]